MFIFRGVALLGKGREEGGNFASDYLNHGRFISEIE